MDLAARRARCIIVDDSETFIEAAREALEEQGLSIVEAVHTGAEAVVRVRELLPEVVLLDVNLAGESGFDVAHLLHQDSSGTASTIIMISTRREDDFTDLIAASPAVGFVAKASLTAAIIYELHERRRGRNPADVEQRGDDR